MSYADPISLGTSGVVECESLVLKYFMILFNKEALICIVFLLYFFVQGKGDEEDDFLKDETPKNEALIDLPPGSFDATLQSPGSCVGSPQFPSL